MRDIVSALLPRANRVLLARRSPSRKAYPGLWSFPGGRVEQVETFEQALVREAREEIGIVPTVHTACGRIADPNVVVTYHMHAVTLRDGGKPAIMNNEHSELGWLTLPDALRLSDLALEGYRPLLRSLLR